MLSQPKLCEMERLFPRGNAIQAKRQSYHRKKKMGRGTYISEQRIMCTRDVKFKKHISRRTEKYVLQASLDSKEDDC